MNSKWTLLTTFLLLTACSKQEWNNPYPSNESLANTYYAAFAEKPKHLDPAISYSSDESTFTAQIYEPVLQYHYLKRPYQLTTLTALKMPTVTYYDKDNNKLPATAATQRIAKSVYDIEIKHANIGLFHSYKNGF